MSGPNLTPQTSGFLTASRAAQLLGIHRCTLWAWIQQGIVPEAAILRCGSRHRIAAWWCLQQSPC